MSQIKNISNVPNAPASKTSKTLENTNGSDSGQVLQLVREIIETLAIAFVLAFLFKTFEGELFLIPTGSMAPTLMGRHKDVVCPKCGYSYQVSASEEFYYGTNVRTDQYVMAGTCPQCRYSMYVGPNHPNQEIFPSFKGDHILVNKYIMDFRRPKRWDVTVFRFPGEPQVNYIKRMIGLENETIQIRNGNIYVKKQEENDFGIARKGAGPLLAMLQSVYSTDYVDLDHLKAGFPERWTNEEKTNGENTPSWETSDHRSFTIKPTDTASWLRYRHRIPASFDWDAMMQGTYSPEKMPIPAQLITDFTAYNTSITRSEARLDRVTQESHGSNISTRVVKIGDKNVIQYVCTPAASSLGINWVNDLAVECELTVLKPQGNFRMELIRGGIGFECMIDLVSGKATFSIPEIPDFSSVSAETPIKGTGTWKLTFTNVDDQLRLFVNSKEISFENDGIYQLSDIIVPTERDLTPVSIGAQDAELKVEHLNVKRDIYYVAFNGSEGTGNSCDLVVQPFFHGFSERDLRDVMSNPSRWKNFGRTRVFEFALKDGEYLVLGDNSPKSSDSRMWRKSGYPGDDFEYFVVPQKYLVGEALYVYWPHGLRIPGTNLNILPNFKKMRFIE